MSRTDLKAGDTVVFINHLYNDVNHMTPHKEYALQETPEQEVWPLSNGMPFYPSLKFSVLNDKGKPISLNACRFRLTADA